MIQRSKKELNMLFWWGFLVGTLCFLIVFGTNTLDVTNDSWIFHCDIDVKQHYIGWISFRRSQWSFPLGMLYNLSYPATSSIVFTDSIPYIAIFFKLIRGVLPETFQYFGWFTLLSCALVGAYFAKLMGRFVWSKVVCLSFAVIAVLSFPMLERSFYHTSLMAQWIILMSFDMWFSQIAYENRVKSCVSWAFVALLCSGIHVYFVPMIFGIMCVSYLEKFISGKKIEALLDVVATSFLMCIMVAISLWALGAFSCKSTGEYWIGEFGSNLNCFINSLGKSLFLPKLDLVSIFQYEGAAYLGLGILILTAANCVMGICYILQKRGRIGEQIEKSKTEIFRLGLNCIRNHPRRFCLLFMCVAFSIAAVFPMVSVNGKIILNIKLSKTLLGILGIFRSNGRFIWPVLYIVILLMPALFEKLITCRKDGKNMQTRNLFVVIMISIVAIQLIDLSPYLAKRYTWSHTNYNKFVTEWERSGIDTNKYKHIVTFEKDVSFLMDAAYFTSRNDITLNNFYYARNVDDQINDAYSVYSRELDEKKPREDVVYAFDLESYGEFENSGLHFYKGERCIYGVKDCIADKMELTKKDIDDIKFY